MAVNSGASSRRDSADMGLCWSMCLLGIISLIFHPRPSETVPISNSTQAPETLYRICCIRNVKSTILRPRPSLWKGELRIWMGWFLGTITAISGHGQGIRAPGFNGQGLDAKVRGLGCRTADPREDEGVFPLGPSSFCFRLCVVLLGSETAKYIAAESQAQKLYKSYKPCQNLGWACTMLLLAGRLLRRATAPRLHATVRALASLHSMASSQKSGIFGV